nr:zf-HC2 domain-containing protein [Streptomyces orinoci]
MSPSRTAAPGGVRRAHAGDHGGVHCSELRTAISARVDDERPPPGVGEAVLDAHLRDCAECRSWSERARRLRILAAGLDLD